MSAPGDAGPSSRGGPDGGRRIRLAGALVVVAAGVVALLLLVRTGHRITAEAAFCSSCHQAESLGAGHVRGHGALPCQACHATPIATGMALLVDSVSAPEHPRKHGRVEPAACATCHASRPAEWNLVLQTEGHRKHRELPGVTCVSCHAATAHTDEPAEVACFGCHHADRLHRASTVGAESCLSCHAFALSEPRAEKPTVAACERCHAEGKALSSTATGRPLTDVTAHALHGGVACQLCHDAHGKQPRSAEGHPACARCHEMEVFQAGTQRKTAPEGHRNCEQCHAPHAPVATALRSCARCHEKNATTLAAGSPSTALKHQSCASCHLPHSWRAERSGCVSCHADKAQLILTRSPPEHGTCTNCHEVHGPPPTGTVCVGCHAKTRGRHVALAPERHKDCTSCHEPHSPSPGETRNACAKCHVTELSSVLREGPEAHAKSGCLGCHQPHDNPLPQPGVCKGCHADNAALVASAQPARHQACLSCHATHRFKIDDSQAACGACHLPAPAGAARRAPEAVLLDPAGPHRGDCGRCHAPHGPPGVPHAACLDCHRTVQAAFKPPNPKHATCGSCHQPHTPASAAPARCGSCHAQQAAFAAKWPATSAHAGPCTGCHEPHDARTKKPCGTCHAAEVASAGASKHRCTQCHAPHQEPPGVGLAWWSRCSDCHAAKVETAKSRGPVHSDCKSCHKPHEFAIPKCESCHQDVLAKGMHRVPRHAASCSACHDPHVESSPSPPQCLKCHSNRVNHEPTAARCQACHVFR